MDKKHEKCINIALWSIIGQNEQMNYGFFSKYFFKASTAHRLTFALTPPVKRKYGFGGVMQGSVVIWQ